MMSPPLRLLLSCPLTWWSSSTIISFLGDAFNCLKDEQNEKKRLVKEKLDKDPNVVSVISDSWVNVLNDEHWELLRKQGSLSKIAKHVGVIKPDLGNSLFHLLRLIRNKFEHAGDYSEDEAQILGWFSNGNFDQHKFVTYWTNLFPNLVMFVWLKIFELRDEATLQEFYPNCLNDDDICWTVEDFLQHLDLALYHHMNEGGLLKRYRCQGHSNPLDLEFRDLPLGIIQSIAGYGSVVKIEFIETNSQLTCSTQLINQSGQITESFEYQFKVPSSNSDKHIILFICNGLEFDTVLSLYNDKATPQKIVLFSNKHINSATHIPNFGTLRENDLQWGELLESKQCDILDQIVIIQNKEIYLNKILPQDSKWRELILQNLKGDLLLDLISNRKPTLLGKLNQLNLPQKWYIPRRIVTRNVQVSSKILSGSTEDIILVSNMSFDDLQLLSNTTVDTTEKQLELPEITHKVLLLDKPCHFELLCKKVGESKNVHLIRFLGEDTFEWVRSQKNVCFVKKHQSKKSSCEQSEEDFLSRLPHTCGSPPVCIADKPGMGKSLLLSSLAAKCSRKFPNRIVLLIPMNDVVIKVRHKPISKPVITQVIKDLIADSDFEKSLVESWLQEDFQCFSEIQCELMFDGLDEVVHKEDAKKLLKVIRTQCKFVRVWVTLRQHMEEEIEKTWGVFPNKILPFDENDQVNFLQKYWLSIHEHADLDEEFIPKLKSLAEGCIKSLHLDKSTVTEGDIAGIPLQCRMLAEIYQDHAQQLLLHFKHKLSDNDNGCVSESNIVVIDSITSLYEEMIEKKLHEVLLKKNVNKDDDFFSPIKREMKYTHMQSAIKILFPDHWTSLYDHIFGHLIDSSLETICMYGLIQTQHPLAFIHRTFAEYFVALFISEGLDRQGFSSNGSKIFSKFLIECPLEVVSEQFSYDPTKNMSRTVACFKFPVICYFLNVMLKEKYGARNIGRMVCSKRDLLDECHDFENVHFDCSKSIFLAAIKNDNFHIAKFLLNSASSAKRDDFLQKIWDNRQQDFIICVAVRYATIDLFKFVCNLFEEWNTKHGKCDEPLVTSNCLVSALRKGRYEIVKFLVTKYYSPCTWAQLRKNDKDKFGLIHHTVRRSRGDKRGILEEKKLLIKYLVELDNSILEDRDAKGRTPLLMQIDASVLLKKSLVKLGADVNAVGTQFGLGVLHWFDFRQFAKAVTPKEYHELLTLYVENGINLNVFDSNKNTPLHCAIKSYHDKLLVDSLIMFKQQGFNFDAQDADGNSVLHLTVDAGCDVMFVKTLCEFGASCNLVNENVQTPLQIAQQKDNRLVQHLFEEM